MKKYKWIIIAVNLILVLFLFNRSVADKETILKNGKLVLLKLAPVDPRSLIQGDYMRLSYSISGNIQPDSLPKRGYCIVRTDSKGVGTRVRFQKSPNPVGKGEYAIEYTANKWTINIGAESYFFQEGKSNRYDSAVYGGLKIDNQGNSILIGLYDKNFRKIE